MGFTTPWMGVLLLAVLSTASSDNTSSVSLEKPERTTEKIELTSAMSNDRVLTKSDTPNRIRFEKIRQNDDNDLAPYSDITMGDLMFYESLINADNKMEESNEKNSVPNILNTNQKMDTNSEKSTETRISARFMDIRRQGELKPEIQNVRTHSDVQFDDAKEITSDPPLRFGQRKPKQRLREEAAPVLQLTQGGYNRPFKRPRYRSQYASRPHIANLQLSRPDSSEQSAQIQKPDQTPNDNRPPEARQVVPQVMYSSAPQQPNALARPQILNSGFELPRNTLAVHNTVPVALQNSFFNTPPTGLSDYTTLPFQTQFPQTNEVGGFTTFSRDPNNADIYQSSQRNPFQIPGVVYQSTPEVQTQPIFINPTRNIPPQFQLNPLTPYPGFESVEDSSRPNYETTYFRNPTPNAQFQVPSSFYPTTPNGINTFNNLPISFLSNYPNTDDKLPSRFFRYPIATQNNQQQNSNRQQSESNSSEEDDKDKTDMKEVVTPTNRNDPSIASFGNQLSPQNEADVYMRYPINEAGYAIEENLPPENISEAKDNGQETISVQRHFPNADPFRNSVLANQRINGSFEFPPELFRGVPVDFGYQRPQSQIFTEYPERNRGVPRYQNPNLEARGPLERIVSLPENDYQIFNVDNQRRSQQEANRIPSCAKQDNVSVCFEDSEYPRNEILYSLNSNSFLAERLSGQEMPLNSAVFVERNSSDETSENYACEVDTKYGSPLRAKNLVGSWRIIVNIQGTISQPVRMEVCKSLGDPCSYADSRAKTTCVQKYSIQRLLSWIPGRGIYSDVYKIPVACSCQILKTDDSKN